MSEQQMQQQMEQLTLQRQRVRVYLKKVHGELMNLNVTDFGLLEDIYYDAPEKPSPNYVDGLRQVKNKKALKVKASVDDMMKTLVRVSREVIDAQKACYRHSIAKRRLSFVSAGRQEELQERQVERQAKYQRKEKLAKVERPSLTELSEAVSDEEDLFGDPDFS